MALESESSDVGDSVGRANRVQFLEFERRLKLTRLVQGQ